MTYVEMLLLTQERGEKILAQDVRFLITDKHRYMRGNGSACDACGEVSPWTEDLEPGAPERHFGRSGEYYIWVRKED